MSTRLLSEGPQPHAAQLPEPPGQRRSPQPHHRAPPGGAGGEPAAPAWDRAMASGPHRASGSSHSSDGSSLGWQLRAPELPVQLHVRRGSRGACPAPHHGTLAASGPHSSAKATWGRWSGPEFGKDTHEIHQEGAAGLKSWRRAWRCSRPCHRGRPSHQLPCWEGRSPPKGKLVALGAGRGVAPGQPDAAAPGCMTHPPRSAHSQMANRCPLAPEQAQPSPLDQLGTQTAAGDTDRQQWGTDSSRGQT